MFGQIIQGHPGLDLVVVGMDLSPPQGTDASAPGKLWDALKPAVMLADPTYQATKPHSVRLMAKTAMRRISCCPDRASPQQHFSLGVRFTPTARP